MPRVQGSNKREWV